MQWTRTASLCSPLTPTVRCAFGLVRQGTRPPSLAPSVPRTPQCPQRVPASRRRACGPQPEASLPLSGAAEQPIEATLVDIRPGKSNTQTITCASSPSVLARSSHVVISLSGRAPSIAAHGATRITSGTSVTGHSVSCNAQLHRLPLHRPTSAHRPFDTRGLSVFGSPVHQAAPATTPASTVAPNPGM